MKGEPDKNEDIEIVITQGVEEDNPIGAEEDLNDDKFGKKVSRFASKLDSENIKTETIQA